MVKRVRRFLWWADSRASSGKAGDVGVAHKQLTLPHASWHEAICRNSIFNEVLNARLCALLAQRHVGRSPAAAVRMRAQFNDQSSLRLLSNFTKAFK